MSRILANSVVLGFGHGSGQIANFLFIVYFARAFGPDVLGEYSFAMALCALLAVVAGFGSQSMATKELARNPSSDRDLVGALLLMECLASVAVMAAIAAIGAFQAASASAYSLLLLLGVHHIVLTWSALLSSRFRARERFAQVAGAEGVRAWLRLALGSAAIFWLHDPVLTVAVYPLSTLLVFLWLLLGTGRRYGRLRLSLNPGRARSLARAARPYFAILIIDAAYQRLGVLLLSLLAVPAVVGEFASAERLVMSLSILHVMFVSVALPAFSRLAGAGEMAALRRLALRSLALLLTVTTTAAALLHLFSEELMHLLFGADYAGAAAVLSVMAWALVLRGFNNFLAALAMAFNAQGRLPAIRGGALGAFAAAAVLLINASGALGLAYAFVLSELTMALVTGLVLRSPIRRMLGGTYTTDTTVLERS